MRQSQLLTKFWKTIPAYIKDTFVHETIVDKQAKKELAKSMKKKGENIDTLTERDVVLQTTQLGTMSVGSRMLPGCTEKIDSIKGWKEFWMIKCMTHAIGKMLVTSSASKANKQHQAELMAGKHDNTISVALSLKHNDALKNVSLTKKENLDAGNDYTNLIKFTQKCLGFFAGVMNGTIDMSVTESDKRKSVSSSSSGERTFGSGSSGGADDGTPYGGGKLSQVPFAWKVYEGSSTDEKPWKAIYKHMGDHFGINMDTPRVVICTSPPWGMGDKFGDHDEGLDVSQVRSVTFMWIIRLCHVIICQIMTSTLCIFDST
jgi:hypothetical protein